MTHSKVKKTGLEVFLILVLCLFVVRGTLYSNGLSKYGYVLSDFFFIPRVILIYFHEPNKGAIRLPAACLYHLTTALFPNLTKLFQNLFAERTLTRKSNKCPLISSTYEHAQSVDD